MVKVEKGGRKGKGGSHKKVQGKGTGVESGNLRNVSQRKEGGR